jgi:hypothetical protein
VYINGPSKIGSMHYTRQTVGSVLYVLRMLNALSQYVKSVFTRTKLPSDIYIMGEYYEVGVNDTE